MRTYFGIFILALLFISYALIQNNYKSIILVPDGFYGTFTIAFDPEKNHLNPKSLPNYDKERRILIYHLNSKQEVQLMPKRGNPGSDNFISYTSGGFIKQYRSHAYDKPLPPMVYDCNYNSQPFSCIVGTPKKVCEYIFQPAGLSCQHLDRS